MNSRTEVGVLRKVAALSPVEYAEQIERRNVALLAGLEDLWERRGEIDQGEEGLRRGRVGCPHCMSGDCNECEWTEVVKNRGGVSCFGVKFAGYFLRDLVDFAFVDLTYLSDAETVAIRSVDDGGGGQKLRYSEYHALKAFIQEHIRWAQKTEWWGTEIG